MPASVGSELIEAAGFDYWLREPARRKAMTKPHRTATRALRGAIVVFERA